MKSNTARQAAKLSKPTPERAAKSPVKLSPKTIADEQGRISQPFICLDVLDRMERRGTITRAMHAAAAQFRKDFRLSNMDALRASNMEGSIRGGERVPVSVAAEQARKRVHVAMAIFGGRLSPAGSLIWAVIGEEKTLEDWAGVNGWGCRPISPVAASGMLVGALCALQVHYGY